MQAQHATPSSPPPKHELWRTAQPNDTAPCPGHSYTIKVKDTDQAITLTKAGLVLENSYGEYLPNNTWLCMDHGVFIGFYNKAGGVYLGHDSKGGMMAKVHKMADWERLSYRRAYEGGYMFLTAHWQVKKKFVNAVHDMTKLAWEDNLHTLWEFEEVIEEV
ncbi:hypothetical protein PRZ48_003110 [Zasmidium cellare]|uniref:Uncharacterized protein n=1 Tax=Zasmidium cellare TaxID=395010 RepID=A0ABR0EUG6_ZASCE|nr:hypothetical protein PRZ48_003110 [Zasmidium cellare]